MFVGGEAAHVHTRVCAAKSEQEGTRPLPIPPTCRSDQGCGEAREPHPHPAALSWTAAPAPDPILKVLISRPS